MRTAVLLMTMGGPDSPEAVRPFLFRLFKDPAILRLPTFLRVPLAWLIAKKREATARANYAKLGGSSPILSNTLLQAKALKEALNSFGEYECFVGMSYSAPFIEEAVQAVAKYRPDQVVLLPLYPQYSTATSASALRDAKRWLEKNIPNIPNKIIQGFYLDKGFIAALADHTSIALHALPTGSPTRFLFAAHGLPEKMVQAGDPYPDQCNETARAVGDALGLSEEEWALCYQSRLGPMKWTGPSVDEELRRAATEGKAVCVVPISFVCEHVETLVEIDMDLYEAAKSYGVTAFTRAQTVSCHPQFIKGLAGAVTQN